MKTAVVIGSGLAGLVAALRLQRAGYRVQVLEQQERAGGLCGTHEVDGFEFVIACNDFGRGFADEMRELDVPIDFHQPQTRFCFRERTYTMPLTPRGTLPLLRSVPGIARFALGMRRGAEYMGPLVRRTMKTQHGADLIHSLAYPLGIHPDRFALDLLRAQFSKEYAYGYDAPHTPVGGPQALIDALVQRLRAGGGTIEHGIVVQQVARDGSNKIVATSQGERVADQVVSSAGRWDRYPERFTPSLAVSSLLFAVDKRLEYPPNVHTLVHFPPGIRGWMHELERGVQPPAFGFHAFRSDLPAQPNHYTLNVLTLAPRGVDAPNDAARRWVRDYVVEHLDRRLPGFEGAIVHENFVSVGEFKERTRMSPHLTPRVTEAGFRKPPIHDTNSGVYYVGNSVEPPGEHAGSAVLSAKLATDAIVQTQAAR